MSQAAALQEGSVDLPLKIQLQGCKPPALRCICQQCCGNFQELVNMDSLGMPVLPVSILTMCPVLCGAVSNCAVLTAYESAGSA